MNKMVPCNSRSQGHPGVGTSGAGQSVAMRLRDLVTGRVQARVGLWEAIESEAHLSGSKEVSDAIQFLVSDVETFAAVQSTAQANR